MGNLQKEKQHNEKREVSNSLDVLIKKWKSGTFYEMADDWKWIFRYSAKYKKEIFFYVFLGILSTTLGLVSGVASKYLIDIITGFQTDKLIVLIVVMVGSSLFSLFFENLLKRMSVQLSVFIHNDIQADIFDKIMNADWLFMNGFTHGDLLNRFNGDVQTVSSNAISWVPTLILSAYKFVATFFVILYYDWVMAVIALGSAPFLFFFSRYLIKKQREYSNKVREISSDMMTYEVEAFYNYDAIKSFGVMPYYKKKMRWWHKKYKDTSLEYNMFSIKTNVVLSLLGLAVQMVAFFYCLFRLWTHDITYGTMTLFLQQRSGLTTSFNQIISMIPAFLNSSVSAHRIREIMEMPNEKPVAGSKEMDAYSDSGFAVRMEGVDFAYVQDKKVITNTDFLACPGEIVALVGPSGEGKTTMIRLILGLVRPQQGQTVLIASSGKKIEMNVETRHLFSYVPQGNTILNGTIAENMRIVREDAAEEELIEALKIACAWDFVEKMPNGIHSSVGEKGRGLSEGQAQRIAIARAVLRDAPILLLDEATSALDVATERRVLRNIVQLRPNKTCIITTHRPSVLNMCQRVYRVMDTTLTELSEKEAGQMAMEF